MSRIHADCSTLAFFWHETGTIDSNISSYDQDVS